MKYLFIFVICLGALNAYMQRDNGTKGNTTFQSSADAPIAVKKDIGDELILFSAVWCPYCKAAKEWLAQNNVAYRDCDIDKEPVCKEHMQAMNTRGVPVLVLKGKVSYGFNAEWVEAGLKAN